METPGPALTETQERSLTLQIFSMSAGMVGVCLTAIGLIRVIITQTRANTLSDDFLAVDAVVFMSCCLLSFWSFKSRKPALRRALRLITDSLFLAGLVLMVGVCAMIAYAIF